jgi:hypothetical protein
MPGYRFSLYVSNLDLPRDQIWNKVTSLFRHFALNSYNQATLSTLRSHCFVIGSWVCHHARKRVLKLSLPHQKRPWMDSIFQLIEARPPPLAYPNA